MSRHRRKTRTLTPPVRLSLYLISLGVWMSGAAWLVLHYFFLKQGEFGPQRSPAEPWLLKAHGLFAFATIWIFGLLWGVHITRLWPSFQRRWSGGLMAGVIALLSLSGYLLYYLGDDKARSVVSILHWGIGLAAPAFFFWHRPTFRPPETKPRSGRTHPLR